MKTLRTKGGLKVLAAVLFVLSTTAVLLSAMPTAWLANYGAYQSGGRAIMTDRLEEEITQRANISVTDGYQNQLDEEYQVDLDEWLGDPNLFYTIKDKDGKTLQASRTLGDYREKYVGRHSVHHPGEQVTVTKSFDTAEERDQAVEQLYETYHGVEVSYSDPAWYGETGEYAEGISPQKYTFTATYVKGDYNEEIVVTTFLRSELEPQGMSYAVLSRAESFYADRDLYLALVAGGAALALLTLVFLTWAAGWKPDSDQVVLRPMDRKCPLIITLLAGLTFAGLALGVGVEPTLVDLHVGVEGLTQGRDLSVDLLFALLIALCTAGALAMYLSLVRQGKAGYLRDRFTQGRWREMLRRGRQRGREHGRQWGQRIRTWGARVVDVLPRLWVILAVLAVLIFLEGLCFANWTPVGWFLLKIPQVLLVLYVFIALQELKRGGSRLAAGDIDYQVPLDRLRGDFKAHGEHLNSMRTAIQAAVEEQMKSERMKTELITNVSHDIKTPLTSIINYVDLMKKQEMPTQESKEYLEVLDRHAAKLKKLTEDLVEAAKASAGTMTVNFQRTDVNVLLTQCAGEYQEKLQAKDLDLVLTPAQDAPAISADGRLLWRVFENLLSNVDKYALPGTRVYLTCESTGERVTLTFRNISASPLNISADELMERFVRGDDARHTEGSGLGLSIARSLTQLQRGTFDLAIDGDLFKAILTFPRIP